MPRPTRCGAALIAALATTGPADAASVGVCGGSGGSQSKTLSCPAGQYIVGLSMRAGTYIDRIGIRCASIDSTGKRGKPGAFQYAGGAGGTDSESGTCPRSGAVTAIHMKAGSYIDRAIHGVCKARAVQGDFDAPTHTVINLYIGGTGGTDCRLLCSEGEAMHRLIVRYGSWVDSIEGFCRP
jgi:hypothetical protein